MSFQTKKITTPPRYCLQLAGARKTRGFSLDELSKKTRIKKEYLRALEECRIEDIPLAQVYIKQYIRCYAKEVGIPAQTLLRAFGCEHKWNQACSGKQQTAPFTPAVTKRSFLNIPKFVRAGALVLVTGMFAAGLVWQLHHFLKPPVLSVINPPDGLVTTDKAITIEGQTEKEVLIHINGTPIQNNEAGHFSTTIVLQKGLNTIAVQATKKSGKQTTETRTIIHDQQSKISLK